MMICRLMVVVVYDGSDWLVKLWCSDPGPCDRLSWNPSKNSSPPQAWLKPGEAVTLPCVLVVGVVCRSGEGVSLGAVASGLW